MMTRAAASLAYLLGGCFWLPVEFMEDRGIDH